MSEKTVLQIGVEPPKSFESFVGDALVLVDDDDSNIVDAVVIEDDAPLSPRDPEVQTRFGRAVFAEVERAHERRPGPMTEAQRTKAEAAVFAEHTQADATRRQADLDRDREAMLLAKANDTWNPSSRGDAMREAAKRNSGKRHTGVRDGEMGER